MLQRFKNKLKEQKGFTLIELLAVIVILGIIAAVAIPSVLGLIDNTKKDAHVANANQLISSAKMAVANNASLQTGTIYITLGYLEYNKYIEEIKDPDSDNAYMSTPSSDPGAPGTTALDATAKAYVQVTNGVVSGVRLAGSTRGVQATAGAMVTSGLTSLKRTNVINNP